MADILSQYPGTPLLQGDPRQLGGYVVLSRLGEGGMGVVYFAIHPTSNRQVAVKVLSQTFGSEPMAAERLLQREIPALKEINDPRVVKFMASGVTNQGQVFYIMEYLAGISLARYAQEKGGRLPPNEAMKLGEEIALAVQAAHDHGFVHRDLKPDNIHLNPSRRGQVGWVKILDFGVAKILTPGGGGVQTVGGQVFGTPPYMSPEQAQGGGVELGVQADVYSLGVMLYEMLTGELPYNVKNPVDVHVKHATTTPPPVGQLCHNCPPELEVLIMAMISTDASDRPSNMGAVVEELARLQGATPLTTGFNLRPLAAALRAADYARPERAPRATATVPAARSPKTGKLVGVVVAIIVIVAIGLAAFVFTGKDNEPTPAPAAPEAVTNDVLSPKDVKVETKTPAKGKAGKKPAKKAGKKEEKKPTDD